MRARVAPRARSRRRVPTRARRAIQTSSRRPTARMSECPNVRTPDRAYGAQSELSRSRAWKTLATRDWDCLRVRGGDRRWTRAARAPHRAASCLRFPRPPPPRDRPWSRNAARTRRTRSVPSSCTAPRYENARARDERARRGRDASNRGGRDRSCYPRRRRRRARRERGEEGRECALEFRFIARARRGARAGVDGGTAGGTRRRRSRGAYPRGVWSARARRGRILRSTRRGWRRV